MSEQSERSSNGSEDRSASQENESGRKRRPRSSLGERNFICGCAKVFLLLREEYLSYPALYTHVRNKHDGIFPIGSYQKKKIPKPVVIYII
jgi:hypothetical protein